MKTSPASISRRFVRGFLPAGALALLASSALANPPGSGWVLKFNDDFTAAPSSANWNLTKYATLGSYNSENWRPVGLPSSPGNVYQSSGHLTLKVTEPTANRFDCGRLETTGVKEYTYGYFECNMKSVGSWAGLSSSFWLKNYPGGLSANSTNEIDVVESFGYNSQYSTNVFKGVGGQPGAQSWQQYITGLSNLDTTYNTYAVEWNSSALKFYFNDTLKRTYTGAGVPANTVKMAVLLSIGAGPQNAGDATTAAMPQQAYYAWVKVWQK